MVLHVALQHPAGGDRLAQRGDGRRMRLHTLVAFFAILGGVSAFGMSGIVLGPVVVAISLALVDIWRQRTAAGQGAENPT